MYVYVIMYQCMRVCVCFENQCSEAVSINNIEFSLMHVQFGSDGLFYIGKMSK